MNNALEIAIFWKQKSNILFYVSKKIDEDFDNNIHNSFLFGRRMREIEYDVASLLSDSLHNGNEFLSIETREKNLEYVKYILRDVLVDLEKLRE